jgi:tRNA(fMet)-specific endonuclease VapC
MRQFLLDTNAVISLLNERESMIAKKVRQHNPGEISISSIVSHELFYGAYKSRRTKQNVDLVEYLQFEVLEFDKEDSRVSGEIRAMLALDGISIGPYDVLIAGQAKARNLVLVTNNTKEFARVSGLLVENWQQIEK